MSNNSEGSGFVLGFMFGALTGAALGLLLAPQPGEVIRTQLKEQSSRFRVQARDRIPELRERAEELAALARQQGLIAVEEVKAAAARLRTEDISNSEHEETPPVRDNSF